MTTINIHEWQTTNLENLELNNKRDQEVVKLLSKQGIIYIDELKRGLRVNSTSYVGSINLENITINIKPKIQGIQLITLMNYAFQFKNLKLMHQSTYNHEQFTFVDVLIYQLYSHTQQLYSRGLKRSYTRQEQELTSPKGRLNFKEIARNHYFPKASLPSIYHERNDNHLINQVLLSGLELAISLTDDPRLKLQIGQLCSYFKVYISPIRLNDRILQKAQNNINRLTEEYRPLIHIITILYNHYGVKLEGDRNEVNLPGFFFDMNRFFEMLVGRLLDDFVIGYNVKSQFTINNMIVYSKEHNPLRKKSHNLRPDFAITKNNKYVKMLDAKYRDLWEYPLPRDMLYQLSIYALSNGVNGSSSIIYPTLDQKAQTQKLNINNPNSSDTMGNISVEPLDMSYLAECLKNDLRHELSGYINNLIE